MRRPPLLDVLVAAGLVALGLAETWVPFSSRQGQGSVVLTSVGVVALGAPLVARRRHPFAVQVVPLIGWPRVAVRGPRRPRP